MTIWSHGIGRRWPRTALVIACWMLLPSWTAAAPVSTAASSERQIAAYHASIPHPTSPTLGGRQNQVRGHVAEARRVLLELQTFVEQATRTLELSDRLRRERRENDRLRRSLSSSEAAKDAFEGHVAPMDAALAALTGTIVRNWLETLRLKYRSEDVDRDLLASEKSRLALQARVATLKRDLVERRSELLALRARRAALGMDIAQMRQRIAERREDTRRMKRQKDEVTDSIDILRRQVTSTLRAVLLESGRH